MWLLSSWSNAPFAHTHTHLHLFSFLIMKFFSTAAVLLAATVASVNAAALDVWAPAVLSPKAGDVWTSGEHVSVTW